MQVCLHFIGTLLLQKLTIREPALYQYLFLILFYLRTINTDAMTFSRCTGDEEIRWQFANHISNASEAISKVESAVGDERCDQRGDSNI